MRNDLAATKWTGARLRLLAFAALLLMPICVQAQAAGQETRPRVAAAALNKAAPDFRLQDLDGKTVSLRLAETPPYGCSVKYEST